MMRDYKCVYQNLLVVKRIYKASVNHLSCNYQGNTSRSCNINLIHRYQDVIHQQWHSSLSVFSLQGKMYVSKAQYVSLCSVYVQTVRYGTVRYGMVRYSTVRVSMQCVCSESSVHVSMQSVCTDTTVRYVSASSVYVQTVRYVSACSVYVQKVQYMSACRVYVQTEQYGKCQQAVCMFRQ
jgi:hypothetical protein